MCVSVRMWGGWSVVCVGAQNEIPNTQQTRCPNHGKLNRQSNEDTNDSLMYYFTEVLKMRY